MKAPPFHTQVRRVELARQHLKAAATLLLEARVLHQSNPVVRMKLTESYSGVCNEQALVAGLLSVLIDAEQREVR